MRMNATTTKSREPPGPVQPVGERRDRENDDEKRHVQQDRGEAVDQKVDHRRHRIEEPGGIVLQPGDADLDQAAERQFRLGEPALQRRPSSKSAGEPLRPARPRGRANGRRLAFADALTGRGSS